MGRISTLQTSFARGVISELALGRTDLSEHQLGLKRAQNVIIGERGELHRRPGSRFTNYAITPGSRRLLPYYASSEEVYVLEFADKTLSWHKERERVLKNGGAMLMGTPYSQDELSELRYAQIGSELILVHPGHAPRKLYRKGEGDWRISKLFFTDGPYEAQNSSDASCSCSGGNLYCNAAPFTAHMVGRQVRLRKNGDWVKGYITQYIGANHVIWNNAATVGSTMTWQMGAFWGGNYPRDLVFHQDRLTFVSTLSAPQSFWMSAPGDYRNFSPSDADGTLTAAHAIMGTLADREYSAISWLESLDSNLIMGSASGVWAIGSRSAEEGLTPWNIAARKQYGMACASVKPALMGQSLVFLDRSKRKLIALRMEASEGYGVEDLSVLADSIMSQGIGTLAFQQSPHQVLWLRRQDGSLASLSYVHGQGLQGWTTQQLGGSYQGGAPKIEDMLVIPNHKEGRYSEELWLLVLRDAQGEERLTLEVIGDYWDYESPLSEAFFVDAGLSFKGEAKSLHQGLDHLAKNYVVFLSDQDEGRAYVNTLGQAYIIKPAAHLSIGYPYTSECELLFPDLGARDGSAQNRPRHLFELSFRLWRSGHFDYGPAEKDLTQTRMIESENASGPVIMTGDLRLKRDQGGWKRAPRLLWRQSRALPLVILSLILRLVASDG